jgi:hypothetical protein
VKLAKSTLALFSSPARRFLAGLERPRPPKRAVIAERLRAVGRPLFEAAIDFEIQFGGLVFGRPGKRRDVKLGIDYRPRRRTFSEDDPDPELVPIGRAHDGYDLLYMTERGEVFSYVDSVVMKNSSIASYIEQELIWYTRTWRAPRFYAYVWPALPGARRSGALGASLAEALGLLRLPLVSDAYEVWWEDRGVRLTQVLFAGSWQSERTSVVARSLDELIGVLRVARSIEPDVRVCLNTEPVRKVRPTRRRRAAAPSMESWGETPGAERYPVGGDVTGVVWITRGRRRESWIQQYRVFRQAGHAPELLSWDTFTSKGGTSRDMEE